jgi:hypothetical protein
VKIAPVKQLLHEMREKPLLWLFNFVPVVFVAEAIKPAAHVLLFFVSILAWLGRYGADCNILGNAGGQQWEISLVPRHIALDGLLDFRRYVVPSSTSRPMKISETISRHA